MSDLTRAATKLFLECGKEIVVEHPGSCIVRCEHPQEMAEADITVDAGTTCDVCGQEID